MFALSFLVLLRNTATARRAVEPEQSYTLCTYSRNVDGTYSRKEA